MSVINQLQLAIYGVLASRLALNANPSASQAAACSGLPSHADLKSQLQPVLTGDNAGLGNEMWASTVDRDGIVCAVAFSGGDRNDQWPGSRVISAQKASTANAFSLESGNGAGIALSSGNLYGVVLEQGSLYGLQFSNPVVTGVAYGANAERYGQPNDPLIGDFIGGVNVFGGGLALYDSSGKLLGGIGVSGDTSCTDHIVAWRVRELLGLDNVPGGVGGNNTDNLNLANPVTPNTFQHPNCGDQGEVEIIDALDGETTSP